MPARPLAVVTGGAGFIGSHMVDLLVGRGFRVHVIDSLVGGHAANLDQHRRDPTVVLEERDVRTVQAGDPLFALACLSFAVPGVDKANGSIDALVALLDLRVHHHPLVEVVLVLCQFHIIKDLRFWFVNHHLAFHAVVLFYK